MASVEEIAGDIVPIESRLQRSNVEVSTLREFALELQRLDARTGRLDEKEEDVAVTTGTWRRRRSLVRNDDMIICRRGVDIRARNVDRQEMKPLRPNRIGSRRRIRIWQK